MRKYLVKKINSTIGLETDFQRVCNEVSKDGWILQEFHTFSVPGAGIIAVFYKDEE